MKRKVKTHSNSANAPKSDSAEQDFTDRSLTEKIGSSLKDMYHDVVKEPIPDDFLKLLADADEKKT